ncbi:MAG: hypothetical protein HYX68_05165 [Planctomycetes bacterium]|nr:hypothetical protein [Planctomycetota bacterium]
MANGIVNITRRRDWPLANPWAWLAAGLGLVLWSWLWVVTFGEMSSDYRVVVLALGLLAGSVGVWLRYRDRQSIYLCAWAAPLERIVRRGLGGLFSVIGLGSTGLFIYSMTPGAVGLATAPAFLVFLTLAAPSYYAARRCFQTPTKEGTPREITEEIALAFVALAALCFLSGFALYLGPTPLQDLGATWYSSAGPNWSPPVSELAHDWDTIRMFVRVLGVVCFYAAVLVIVSPGVRRATLSLLFVLHFMGISTACLAAPPAPWLVTQAWVRVFKPYLEFVYLVNAYHFYAPDPNASTHLWFRLIYEDTDGNSHGWWYKVPHVDEQGRIHHTVDLEYVRFLAMTESVAHSATLPPPFLLDNLGQTIPHPLYHRRLQLLPLRVAQPDNVPWPRIPLHPRFSQMQQVSIPTEDSKRRLASFTRFVARKYNIHPEHRDWRFKSVKVYRVLHEIPPVELLVNGIPPNDPQLYLPYFMGNFDSSGELIFEKERKKLKEFGATLERLQQEARVVALDPNKPDTKKKRQALAQSHEALQQEVMAIHAQVARLNVARAASEIDQASRQIANAVLELRQGRDCQDMQKQAYEGIYRALMEISEDPYLYWLLPSLRDTDLDVNSGIKDYCRRHAGDSHWYRSAGTTPAERQWEERLGP